MRLNNIGVTVTICTRVVFFGPIEAREGRDKMEMTCLRFTYCKQSSIHTKTGINLCNGQQTLLVSDLELFRVKQLPKLLEQRIFM